ncbi:MAG: aldo/keto reductase [Rhodobacteraceae bacterium]|nr:aldo/keto reductase [Paracoccaceae bacterium]
MQHRQMGRDGPKISSIGIGAMSFSDFYGPTDEAASHAILDTAQDLGVTHIDTSNVYGMGRSETVIGTYFKAQPEARAQFHIATKAAISRDNDGNRVFDNSAMHLEAELDKSLKRMGIEQVDLFYIHRRDADMVIEEATQNLARLVQSGKTRAIGFSEIAPSTLRRAAAVHPIAAVQSEYSLSTRSPEMGLVQVCAELGTALVAFSPVARSLLTDNPLARATIPGLSFLAGNPRFMEPNLSANLEATERFRKLAAEMQTPAAALAISWLLHQGDHVIPIPGTRSVSHFHELVAGVDLSLSSDDLARMEQVLPIGWAHGDRYNQGQWIGPERYC